MGEFRELLDEKLKDPKFKAEYDRLQPEFEIRGQIIKARIEKNLTQKEFAELIGTKQSSISRFEKGGHIPSIEFLQKMADGLNKKLRIEFQ